MTCKRHKFQPRYSKEWSTVMKDAAENGCDFNAKSSSERHVESINAPYLQKKTYIFDICVNCGLIVRGDGS